MESPAVREPRNWFTTSRPDFIPPSPMSDLPQFRISFPEEYTLSERDIKLVGGLTGIYFIYLDKVAIQYPFARSRLIYIGLSESRQNSIGKRLRAHLTGQSGNLGIKNYASRFKVNFTYHSLDVLSNLGTCDLYELEAFFLTRFLDAFGAFPICNNQSGVSVLYPRI